MGGPRKPKEPTKTERTTEMMDKLLADIDPLIVASGFMGAIATAGGVTPPFTRMLSAINSEAGSDVRRILEAPGVSAWWQTLKVGSLPVFLADLILPSSEQATKDPQLYALMISGAFEAMLMMAFAKNPNSMELLGKIVDAATPL